MNTQSSLEQLQQLKMHGMHNRYKAILEMPVHQQPQDMHALVALLIMAEKEHRNQQRSNRYLRRSKLRYDAVPEEIKCTPERNLSKDTMALLADGAYIRKGKNILITGATGCGKSYLACALGRQACEQGYSSLFLRMNTFIDEIAAAQLDGTVRKRVKQIERINLLILDDFGLKPLDNATRLILLDILEDRYKKAATIITSQLPIAKWYETIGENPTAADAIMDRLTSNAHRIELKGTSMRKDQND